MIDSQLMQRYVGGQDSLAFRDLVDRHGPAVLRVCRRFVHDSHEAEDAMQATFLILAQRAPSIREPEQLNRWLTGVARRVAARAQRRMIRRTEREQLWAETRPEASTDAEKSLHIELRRAVREELGQLSAADRQPLTLCYLDGMTHEEAARRIGCPVGTIKARLVRARRRLRDRLDRRGVALSLGLLFLLLRRSSPVSASDTLAQSTAEAMALTAAGDQEAVRDWYPRVATLARSAPVHGWLSTWKPVVALIFGLTVVALGSAAFTALVISDRAETTRASTQLMKLLDLSCQVKP